MEQLLDDKRMSCDREVLAANLRGFRARKHMTQAEVAEAVGIHEASVSHYENGESGMSYETAWKLADLYGVTLAELGGREE